MSIFTHMQCIYIKFIVDKKKEFLSIRTLHRHIFNSFFCCCLLSIQFKLFIEVKREKKKKKTLTAQKVIELYNNIKYNTTQEIKRKKKSGGRSAGDK